MNLTGKVILITGAVSGIGASCAEEFLKNNVKGVVIADINNSETAIKLSEKYGNDKVTFVRTDVTERKSFDDAFQKTIDAYHQIDILINCAGIVDEVNYDRTILVNLLGVALGCDLAINKYFPKYRSDSGAYIINIASIAGLLPSRSFPHYAATKHGVVGLTRSYGANTIVTEQKICVMALCPGVTDTPILEQLVSPNVPYSEQAKTDLSLYPLQKVEAVSRSAVEILQNPETGSIWLINDDVLTKVELPSYATLVTSS